MLNTELVITAGFCAVALVAAGALFGAWVTWTTQRMRADAYDEALEYARCLALGELLNSDKKMPAWVAEYRRTAVLPLRGQEVAGEDKHETSKQARDCAPKSDVPGPAKLHDLHSTDSAAD